MAPGLLQVGIHDVEENGHDGRSEDGPPYAQQGSIKGSLEELVEKQKAYHREDEVYDGDDDPFAAFAHVSPHAVLYDPLVRTGGIIRTDGGNEGNLYIVYDDHYVTVSGKRTVTRRGTRRTSDNE